MIEWVCEIEKWDEKNVLALKNWIFAVSLRLMNKLIFSWKNLNVHFLTVGKTWLDSLIYFALFFHFIFFYKHTLFLPLSLHVMNIDGGVCNTTMWKSDILSTSDLNRMIMKSGKWRFEERLLCEKFKNNTKKERICGFTSCYLHSSVRFNCYSFASKIAYKSCQLSNYLLLMHLMNFKQMTNFHSIHFSKKTLESK